MEKPLYFMHIAKAAGSSINALMQGQFSDDEVLVHFESIPDAKFDRTPDSLKFISGHPFYYHACRRFPWLRESYKLTLLREPFHQLCSHIAWIRRLAEPENIFSFRAHAPHFQEMAKRLQKLDLSSPKDLRTFANDLNRSEQITFYNFQTRYFVQFEGNTCTNNQYRRALSVVDGFDLVGITENIEVFVCTLFDRLGWENAPTVPSLNVARTHYGLDPADRAQNDALFPLVEHDLKLYSYVCSCW